MDGSAVDGGSAVAVAAVDVDATKKKGDKRADRLQRDVDPQLLVSSKSKGPPRPRQFPTQKQPKLRKVCLHDAACAWREVPDSHGLGVPLLGMNETSTTLARSKLFLYKF